MTGVGGGCHRGREPVSPRHRQAVSGSCGQERGEAQVQVLPPRISKFAWTAMPDAPEAP